MVLLRALLVLLSASLNAEEVQVARLGSEDWAEREAAETALRQRGWAARTALRRGCDSLDPEIRHRCQSLYNIALDEVVASLGPIPMIDALWYDADSPHPGYKKDHNPEFRAAYDRFNPYLERLGRDVYPYRNYYLATELAVRELLEEGMPPEALRPMLDEMRRRDDVFLRRSRPVSPPPGE
jgi:hypothetical protein